MEQLVTKPLNYKLFFGGEWIESDSGKTVEVLNPSNEEVIGTVQSGNEKDAQKALEAAKAAQDGWGRTPARKRADLLRAFTKEIMSNRDYLAEIICKEQGKLFRVAQFEVDVVCSFIEYACDWARIFEGDIIQSDNENEHIWIHKIPRGVVVAITAWNYPLALAARKIGPALVTGNTLVLKPTTETPLATMELGYLAKKAGIPDGVLNIVTGPGRTLGSALVKNPITKMVTMTGSTPAGQQICRDAAENMAHVQLELGGKAPCIVFEDADIDAAVAGALHSRFDNCGQVCTCNERLYVQDSVYDEFMEKFLEKVKAIKVGDPMDPSMDMGPKVNKAELDHMEELVKISLKEGASVATGGKRPEGEEYSRGYWFEPTILTDVKQEMTIVHEESFGPILPVVKFNTFEEVIKYANDCQYGLAAMVFTKNMDYILRLNSELEFGEIYINRGHGEQHQGFHNGYKLSGSGGEDGKFGIEQYLEKKTFYVKFNG